jgi:hypothetical protein
LKSKREVPAKNTDNNIAGFGTSLRMGLVGNLSPLTVKKWLK